MHSFRHPSIIHPLIHSSTHPLILIRSPLKHHSFMSSFAYSFLPAFVHFISFHFIHSFVIFIHSFIRSFYRTAAILACHDEGLELGANLLAGEKQLWRPKLCGTDGSALDEVAGLQWTSWPPADCALEDQSSFKAELLPLRVCLLQRLTPALHHPLDTVSTIFHCGFIISHRAIPAGAKLLSPTFCASLTCQHLVLGFARLEKMRRLLSPLWAFGNHLYCGESKHTFRNTLVGAQRAISTLRGCDLRRNGGTCN